MKIHVITHQRQPYSVQGYTMLIKFDGQPDEHLKDPKDLDRHEHYHGQVGYFRMDYTQDHLNHFMRRVRPEFEDVTEETDNVRQELIINAESLRAFALFNAYKWRNLETKQQQLEADLVHVKKLIEQTKTLTQ